MLFSLLLFSSVLFTALFCWSALSFASLFWVALSAVRSFAVSFFAVLCAESFLSAVWRVVCVDLLSSKDKCTTSGVLSSLVASVTCSTTSLGSWLRRVLDWLLLVLAAVCWIFCLVFSAVNVSPRSSLPRELRWVLDLRLVRICSSAVLLSFCSALSLLSSLRPLLLLLLRPLSWRLLRLRSLGRLLFCWRLSWLSVDLSSVLVAALLLTLSLVTSSLLVSSCCSFLWCGLEDLDLRGLRLLLSSALLSSVSLSVLRRACWRLALLFDAWLLFFWLLSCWVLCAEFWALSVNTLLSTCPKEPKLCAPLFTSASIASAASRLLTPLVVCACGACANRLDNQATACGWAAVTLVVWVATGTEVLTTFGVFCGCGTCADETVLVLLRRSLLWLTVLVCCCSVVIGGVVALLSATWRGWRVGCCSGRSFSAVCQSTL